MPSPIAEHAQLSARRHGDEVILPAGRDVPRCGREDAATTQRPDGPTVSEVLLPLHLRDGDRAPLIDEGELRAVGQVRIEILDGNCAPLVLNALQCDVHGP